MEMIWKIEVEDFRPHGDTIETLDRSPRPR